MLNHRTQPASNLELNTQLLDDVPKPAVECESPQFETRDDENNGEASGVEGAAQKAIFDKYRK